MSFVLHIDVHLFELANQYGLWLYAILFVIVFCETGFVVTPFLPGDSLLFASGVVAGGRAAGLWRNYGRTACGGHTGRCGKLLYRAACGPAIFSREKQIHQKVPPIKAHDFYERHGGKAIVLARFVPIVRTFAPFVAALPSCTRPRSFCSTSRGVCCGRAGLSLPGIFLGNLEWARQNFSLIVYGIIIVSVLPVAIEVVRGRMGKHKDANKS